MQTIKDIQTALHVKFFTSPALNNSKQTENISKYIEKTEVIVSENVFANLSELIGNDNFGKREVKVYICSLFFWIRFHSFDFLISNSKLDRLTYWQILSAAIVSANAKEPIQ